VTAACGPAHTLPGGPLSGSKGVEGWGIRRRLPRLLAFLAFVSTPVLADLHQGWYAPRAAEFAQASASLPTAIGSLCAATPVTAPAALEQARARWLESLAAWERFSAVAIGPLLERRAQRQLDFNPTRPHLIEKAVHSAPNTPADMERIGTPAKGLPALEWLLWVKPARPASPECRYAVQVAAEIAREADALAGAPPISRDESESWSELLNQWLFGLEKLRWAGMEMPLRRTMTAEQAGRALPVFPRQASAATATAWREQWRALRELALGPFSLRAALAARGVATKDLEQALERADQAMDGLNSEDGGRILAAAETLGELQKLVETRVASALGVSLGFSDADGD